MASFTASDSNRDYFVENADGELSFTSEQTGKEEERYVQNIEPYLFEPEAAELVGAEANVYERPDEATSSDLRRNDTAL